MATVILGLLLVAGAASAMGDDVLDARDPEPVWPAPTPLDPPPKSTPLDPPSKPTPRRGGQTDQSPDDVPVGAPRAYVENDRNPEASAPTQPEPPMAPGTDPERLGVPEPQGGCRTTGCTAGHAGTQGTGVVAPSSRTHGDAADMVAVPDQELLVAAGAGAGIGFLAFVALLGRSTIAAGLLRAWTVLAVRRGGDELDGHPVRSTVLRHLEVHPGATTRELATVSGVTYRRVVYHLAMLERGKRLRVRVVGRKRLHFAANAPRIHDDELRLRALADPATSSGRMLAHMADAPGPSLSRIARTFGLSVGNTHYHVQRLRDAGLVHATRHGSRIRHYLTARGREWVERMMPLARVQKGAGAGGAAPRTARGPGSGVAA